VFFVLWANLICFVLWYGFFYIYIYIIYIYIYIYIFHCINLIIIETIQEVDATSVHGSIL
jgi:hypothetical protein